MDCRNAQQPQRIIAWRQLFFIFDYDTKVCYVFPAITATAAVACHRSSQMVSYVVTYQICNYLSSTLRKRAHLSLVRQINSRLIEKVGIVKPTLLHPAAAVAQWRMDAKE